MDDSKDVQKTDDLSKTLDAHSIRTNPFGRNISGDRAYRRAERLAAAIHILTNHIPIEEPSRQKAREASIHLLSVLLGLRDKMRVSTSPSLHTAQALIRELISLMRVLSVAGYLSLHNTGAVTEALDELGNFLVISQRSGLSESLAFSKDELLDIREGNIEYTPRTAVRRAPQGSIKDMTPIKDTSRTADTISSTGGSDTRAQAVIEVLRSQGEIGIKDISANLPEYSEKMVQRELSRLIVLGRVRKSGFKRWSRYTFVR